MRSSIFEAAVVNKKLQTIFLECKGRLKLTDIEETRGGELHEGLWRGNASTLRDILAFCARKQSIKRLMSNTHLRQAQITNYRDFMVCQDLLTRSKGTYVATEKGRRLLELFVKLRDFFGINQV
jgi:predicted transcriptional regulator